MSRHKMVRKDEIGQLQSDLTKMYVRAAKRVQFDIIPFVGS